MFVPESLSGSMASCCADGVMVPRHTNASSIAAARVKTRLVMRKRSLLLLLLALGGVTHLRLARVDFLREVVVAHVSDVDPGVRHFVAGAIAPANPLARIGVALLGGRVVVPRGDLEDRALRQQ